MKMFSQESRFISSSPAEPSDRFSKLDLQYDCTVTYRTSDWVRFCKTNLRRSRQSGSHFLIWKKTFTGEQGNSQLNNAVEFSIETLIKDEKTQSSSFVFVPCKEREGHRVRKCSSTNSYRLLLIQSSDYDGMLSAQCLKELL